MTPDQLALVGSLVLLVAIALLGQYRHLDRWSRFTANIICVVTSASMLWIWNMDMLKMQIHAALAAGLCAVIYLFILIEFKKAAD